MKRQLLHAFIPLALMSFSWNASAGLIKFDFTGNGNNVSETLYSSQDGFDLQVLPRASDQDLGAPPANQIDPLLLRVTEHDTLGLGVRTLAVANNEDARLDSDGPNERLVFNTRRSTFNTYQSVSLEAIEFSGLGANEDFDFIVDGDVKYNDFLPSGPAAVRNGNTLTWFASMSLDASNLLITDRFNIRVDAFGQQQETALRVKSVTYKVVPVPEPTTLALVSLGLVGAGFSLRRARSARS